MLYLCLTIIIIASTKQVSSDSGNTFDSKNNPSLYCEIKNEQALSELSIGPEKHLYTDYTTGNVTKTCHGLYHP